MIFAAFETTKRFLRVLNLIWLVSFEHCQQTVGKQSKTKENNKTYFVFKMQNEKQMAVELIVLQE